MVSEESPSDIVERQLRAYNARDIDAYCSLFANEAIIYRLGERAPEQELARGIDAIRAYYTERFRNTALACEVRSRTELGRFVVDHERVTGIGSQLLEVIAIYEVHGSLIHSVRILWPAR
jgi:hypothetical protein